MMRIRTIVAVIVITLNLTVAANIPISKPLWTIEMNSSPKSILYDSSGNKIYCMMQDKLIALIPDSGKVIWTRKGLDSNGRIIISPIGLLLISSGHNLLCINKEGEILWSRKGLFSVKSEEIELCYTKAGFWVDNGSYYLRLSQINGKTLQKISHSQGKGGIFVVTPRMVIFRTSINSLKAVSSTSGANIWDRTYTNHLMKSREKGQRLCSGDQRIYTNRSINAQSRWFDGDSFLLWVFDKANSNGNPYIAGFDLNNGKLLWKQESSGAASIWPLEHGYLVSDIYQHAKGEEVKFRFMLLGAGKKIDYKQLESTPGYGEESLVARDGVIYFSSFSEMVVLAVRKETGKILWVFVPRLRAHIYGGSSFLGRTGNPFTLVYVTPLEAMVIDPATGKEKQRINFADWISRPVILSGKHLIVYGEKRLYCYHVK